MNEKSMALVKLNDCFGFSDGKETLIVVDIIEGTIEIGMNLFIGQESFKILGIEHIDGKTNDSWISRIAVRVRRIENANLIKDILGNTVDIVFSENDENV